MESVPQPLGVMVSAILAHGPRGELGYRGDLPWPALPADRRWFFRHTRGKVVVMGRRTWESLPPRARPLRDRENIVVTRSPEIFVCGRYADTYWGCNSLWVQGSFVGALRLAGDLPGGYQEAVILGGRSLFAEALSWCERAYVTEVQGEWPADVFLDLPWPGPGWTVAEERTDPGGPCLLRFRIYTRDPVPGS
jgi:dihydrofolate reductase